MGYVKGCVEAASGYRSPQHEQEETSPRWEELRRRDEAAADHNFDDFVINDADTETYTTEVFDDKEIVQLVPAHKRSLKMRTIRILSKLPCPHQARRWTPSTS
ncbi:hypothetical protein HPB52_023394 [Rhipicephalus sanguineus]|uniref:Uncharacterized protein n=1 Tax=Rhipicephalus sanguineus TaxID=34632 RepID=A0A9D4TC45_RHISA|nr:hypothetical protein HPB52_023394 [Rhipicephalus sanguineus]